MASEKTFLGLTRGQQLAAIAVVGVVLVIAGQLGSSAVDPDYDPLLFGIGLVMVVYAVVAVVWDRGRALLAGD